MGQSGGELSEGNHLFVMQIAGSECACAIEHGVNKRSRDLMTFFRQFADLIARQLQNLGAFLSDRVARWAGDAGVWQQTHHVTSAPFYHFARPGSSIDEHGE
jgi:hypothetical protein